MKPKKKYLKPLHKKKKRRPRRRKGVSLSASPTSVDGGSVSSSSLEGAGSSSTGTMSTTPTASANTGSTSPSGTSSRPSVGDNAPSLKKKRKERRNRKRRPRKRKGISLNQAEIGDMDTTNSNTSSGVESSTDSGAPKKTQDTATEIAADLENPSSTTELSGAADSGTDTDTDTTQRKKKPKKETDEEVSTKEKKGSAEETDRTKKRLSGGDDANAPFNEKKAGDSADTAATKEQAERWELQDKLAEAKRKKIEDLKEKNPKLYKKIQQMITEQENKIKKFAAGLKTKEEKAAFVAYSKNFLLNTWTQKFRDRRVKTGLRESKFNYDRIIFQKLSPDEQKQLTNLIDETKAKSRAFQATLSPAERADFEDMDANPRLNRLSTIVEAGKSKNQKKAESQQQSDANLLENAREQRKNLYKLQRKKNKGILTADDVRAIDNLNQQLANLQKEIKSRGL